MYCFTYTQTVRQAVDHIDMFIGHEFCGEIDVAGGGAEVNVNQGFFEFLQETVSTPNLGVFEIPVSRLILSVLRKLIFRARERSEISFNASSVQTCMNTSCEYKNRKPRDRSKLR